MGPGDVWMVEMMDLNDTDALDNMMLIISLMPDLKENYAHFFRA